MDTSPFSTSTTSNWVARAGGLPDYVRGVAHALLRKGRAADESRAIEMAVGLMQDWASGRTSNGKGHVHPAVQAAAAKALAQWSAMKASAHANDGAAAVELAGLFNEALHPRVAAGNTGGGQFGSKNVAAVAKNPGSGKAAVAKAPGKAAQAAQLRAQASKYRERAADIRAQIRAEVQQIHAAVTLQRAALAASAKAAHAAASGKKVAKKTVAKTSVKKKTVAKKTTVHKVTTAQRAAAISSMRSHVSRQRLQVRALDQAANKLDAQAAHL